MKGRISYSCLLIWLFFSGFCSSNFAQTISNVTFPASTVCPGSNVTVSYTTSASFVAGNVFTAYLSDATGTSYPTVIGTVTSRVTGTINATIPTSTATGSGYKIQVKAANGISANSTTTLTVNRPTAPGVTPPSSPYCETDAAQALVATASGGGSLNWYGTNASGGTASGTPTIPSTAASAIGTTLYYVSQTVGGCESSRASIAVTVKDKPNTPGVVTPLTYCVGQSASALTATPGTGGSLNWYTVASGGSASSTAPVPPTSAATTLTYYVSQTLNGCEGPRAAITVTVNAIPAAPTATAPAPYCEGSSPQVLTATPAAGGTLTWYGTNASGGSGSGNATVPSTAAVGSTIYYVSQTVKGCESSRTGITVQVVESPDAPTVAAVAAYCQNQTATALSATPSTGATLNWYGTNASGGSPSVTPTTPVTSQAGTVNYYVSQSLNGCEGPRALIPVAVKATPSLPTISSPLIACQNRTGYSLTATPSAGGSLNWYGTNASGGSSSATAPVLSTTSTGSQTYYVSQSVNGCESARAALIVTVNAVPAAPTATAPAPYCEGSSPQALTATPAAGGTLTWYGTDASSGSGSGNATVPSTAAVGSTIYYVSQTVSSCESERTGITVQVKDTPNAPGTSAVEFCQGTSVPTLTASLVSNATVNWYGTNSSGGTASTTAPVPSSLTVGTTLYYVSQILVGCESPRASLSVRVKLTPSAPGVSPVSFCNNSQAQQLTAAGTSLKWFDASDNLLGGAPTPNTGTVGNQTFKVSQTTNEGCEGPKASVVVTINPLPGPPSVANLTYCQSQEDQPQQGVGPLTANSQGSLKWFFSDGSPSAGAPTPSIKQAGTQIFQVSQIVNNCEGAKAILQVTVTTPPAPVVPKPVVTYCINDKASPLEAVGEAGSQLKWIDPYGVVTNNAPTPLTLNTNVQPQGDPFYVYQIASNGCYSARSIIRVVVNTTPTLSLFAPTPLVNLGLKAPLQLKFTGSGPYSYSLTNGYSGTARADTTISVLPRSNTTYQVTSISNGCGTGLPGNSATIAIRVPSVSTSSLATSTLCAGTSLSVPFVTTGEFNPGNAFRIEMVSVTDTTKKYAVPTSANNSPVTGAVPTSLPGGQYYVRIKADNPEIAIIGTNSPTLLTVRSFPTATLTGTQAIYEGTPVNLTLTFGGDGPWKVTYTDSLRSYPLTVTANPYVVEARPVRTTTYSLINVSNSCGTGTLSGTAVVTVLPLLGVDDHSLDPLVKAYPVPTATTLIVELNLPLTHDPATLSLTDLRGRPILQHTTRNQHNELNLTAQPSGLYLLRIQVGDRQTVRKVLKQ